VTKSLRPLRKIVPFVLTIAVGLSACGSTTANNAFSIEGTSYSRSQFDELVEALIDAGQFASTDGKVATADAVTILRTLIRYEAFVKFIAKNDFTVDEADRKTLITQADADAEFGKYPQILQDTLINLNLADVTLKKFKAPTDSVIEKLYSASPASAGTLCLSHILVKTEAEARTVLADLEKGTAFADEAAKKSIEPGADKSGGALKDGESDCQTLVKLQGSFDPDFMRGAVDAKPGVPTGPVKSSFGYHVILSHPYDKVKTSVLSIVQDDPGNNLLAGYLSSADITVNSVYGTWDGALGTIK
jgi:parvulin-like peptidyl-prolyl isomerase